MANTKSAKKAIRQIDRRTAQNINRRSRIRTYVKRDEEAIAKGDKEAAQTALREAQPEIMRGVTHGTTHANTAARKVSRLAKRVNAIGSSAS